MLYQLSHGGGSELVGKAKQSKRAAPHFQIHPPLVSEEAVTEIKFFTVFFPHAQTFLKLGMQCTYNFIVMIHPFLPCR